MKKAPVTAPSALTDDDDLAALQRELRGVVALAAPNRTAHERQAPAPLPRPREVVPPSFRDLPPQDRLAGMDHGVTPLKAQNRVIPARPALPDRPSIRSPETDQSEFSHLFGSVTAVDQRNRLWIAPPKPAPVVRQAQSDAAPMAAPMLSDQMAGAEDENTELLFLRPGQARDLLRKLGRGEWGMQAEVDFHGCTVDEARERFAAFMQRCLDAGYRCVRMVHGKGLGSRNSQPVIKPRLRAWLVQHEHVLAFCPARPLHGGYGAVVVLLRADKARALSPPSPQALVGADGNAHKRDT